MKRMNFYILGGALVLLILLTASCACCDFKPHSKKVSFSKYEGMEGEGEGEGMEGEGEGMEGEGEGEEMEEPLEEDEEMEGFEGEDDEEMEGFEGDEEEDEDVDERFGPYEGYEDEEEEEEEPESMMSQIKSGFSGLLGKNEEGMVNNSNPRPYSEDTLYDIYGPPTKGSLECGSRSAGLTNSKGPLCLSDKQLNMLKTRGGNASNDAQIGA